MKKIEFVSLVPGLIDVYPIIPAKEYRPDWVKKAREDFLEKNKQVITKDFHHIYHCPGIFELFNEGFIVPMWHDIIIDTNTDRKNYRYQIPSDTLVNVMSDTPIISHHDDLAKELPYPDHSMKFVLKFNTPWRIIAPKNLRFLVLPLNYPDNFTFTSVTGILDPSFSNEINIQVFWNVIGQTTYLKAGTPMMQIIPLSEKKYDMICREKTKLDELWELKRKFIWQSSWSVKKNLARKAFWNNFSL